MNKKNILWLILDSIFILFFNALFFLLGGASHGASVWISYGFIHFAYFMLLLTPKLIRTGKSSAVFGFSLYYLSSVYFLIQLVAGGIIILIAPEGTKAAIVIQLCLAGLYAILLVANMIANERTADDEAERQYRISYVKEASGRVKGLTEGINDKEAQKKIERLYDALYSSPVKSHPALEQMETRILGLITELEDAVSVKNKEQIISLSNTLLSAVNERNLRIKTLGS